jgi:hypothetical protein
MVRSGFLNAEDRRHLIALARDGWAAPLTRQANALVLLDDGLALHATAPAAPSSTHGAVGFWEAL